MSKAEIMKIFKPFLWSYDTKKMDLVEDEKRIITNVLNFGTFDATKLLFRVYDLEKIKQVVINPLVGEWNKKSLNYWSLMLKVKPKLLLRKIPKM